MVKNGEGFQTGKMREVVEIEMQKLSSLMVSEQTILTKHTCII